MICCAVTHVPNKNSEMAISETYFIETISGAAATSKTNHVPERPSLSAHPGGKPLQSISDRFPNRKSQFT